MKGHTMRYHIRQLTSADQEALQQFFIERWGDTMVVGHGVVYQPQHLEGFVVIQDEQWIGALTFTCDDQGCEVVTIDSLREGQGIGAALIDAVVAEARRRGCTRVWLITTNDNLNALRFYQKRGFALVAVHRNAVMEARKIKPSIPLIGNDGIPLRDELELEMTIEPARSTQ